MDMTAVNELIELIKYRKGIAEVDISTRLRRGKDYISQQRSRGRFTKKFINDLKNEYADVLIQPDVNITASIESINTKLNIAFRHLADALNELENLKRTL